MRCFWLICFIILTTYSQQPPSDPSVRTWTVIEHVTLKNESIAEELQKLRDKLKESAQLECSQTIAALHQRGNDILDESRALEFSCIIDRENDATILSQLVNMQKRYEEMLNLEAKLEKQDVALTHHAEKILQGQDDAATHLEIMLQQEQLFKSMLQLMYQQTIRRFQKLSEIRGAFAKLPKP